MWQVTPTSSAEPLWMARKNLAQKGPLKAASCPGRGREDHGLRRSEADPQGRSPGALGSTGGVGPSLAPHPTAGSGRHRNISSQVVAAGFLSRGTLREARREVGSS